jgi:ABC-type dipeptide/oligopeptide/nickel transport system permease component
VPRDHPLYRSLEAYELVKATGDVAQQRELFNTLLDVAASNTWTIGICTSPKYVVNVQNGFSNVTSKAASTFAFLSPGNTGQETYYFENAQHTPEQATLIKDEIVTITPEPRTAAAEAKTKKAGDGPTWLGRTFQWTFIGIALALVLMAAIRHPYIGRRLLIMIPTLFVISIIVFTIIQLPPGDFITSKIVELQMKGDAVDAQELANIKQMYHLDDPMVIRYCRWMGLAWFVSFKPQDEGLLQGNLGRSMASNREVSQIVGDRITLTILLSLGSILFTWAIALPVGIYSAVRQYSVADYVLTFLGFIGMCIPSFLLAVVLMYWCQKYLGMQIDGLFSPQYAMQPYWDWAKFVDLLKHLWIPVAILGIGGTGGMIRVMRGNLLDELKKPYVTTARAKGVRPMKLLFKYPVRIALNPFISGIGGLFPAMISGGTLISVVLSLPTIGPMMLDALMNEDTLLAGSMLMILSVLGVLGVLISDLLLLWIDPRIRFEGGSR